MVLVLLVLLVLSVLGPEVCLHRDAVQMSLTLPRN